MTWCAPKHQINSKSLRDACSNFIAPVFSKDHAIYALRAIFDSKDEKERAFQISPRRRQIEDALLQMKEVSFFVKNNITFIC